MALAAETFTRDDQPTKRPGDFYRSATGTPYVSDPSGAIVKSGARKGEPCRIAYGRPSGFGKQIEDTYGLTKWSERTIVHGIGVDYADAASVMALPELAARCATLVDLDPGTPEFRSAADAIVVEAQRLAKAGLAAERGTHTHSLTEDNDTERDPIARAEHGELLGLDRDVQQALVAAWQEMLDRHGLVILATELAVVHDGYRMAGTLDRIAQLTKPLRFTMLTGEIVEVEAGSVLVLDIKTGRRRLDRNGVPMFWQAYAVQIATYAGAVPYVTEIEQRFEWAYVPGAERGVDQRWALIAHLDVLGAIDGNPSCELVLVDIEAGRAAADLCLAAKAWEKRADVFSVSHISEAAPDASDEQQPQDTHPATASTQQAPADIPPSAGAAAPTPQEEPCPPTSTSSTTPSSGQSASTSTAMASSTTSSPPLGTSLPSTTPPTNAELHARLRRHPNIDEGTVDDPEQLDTAFTRMAEHFLALPNTAKAWAAALQVQAQQHGCGFHAKEAHTLRRFELIRGLIALSVANHDCDDLIRYLVHHVTGDDAALFPAITPGHALGSLDADEARAFAAACDQLAADQIVLTFTDESQPQFVTRRAA